MQIDAALLKAGIKYLDIRVELTDHIAAALEQQDGGFEPCLATYIQQNDKNLKALNSRFAAIAMKKTFMAFIKNIGSKRFAIVAALSLAAGEAINWFLPGSPAPMVMFFVFSVPLFLDAYNPMFTLGPKKPVFSVGKYYYVVTAAITFISVWLLRFWDTQALSHFILLSYALLTAVADAKYNTTKNLFEQYKARYHAA